VGGFSISGAVTDTTNVTTGNANTIKEGNT
jgi:hypothetical protein